MRYQALQGAPEHPAYLCFRQQAVLAKQDAAGNATGSNRDAGHRFSKNRTGKKLNFPMSNPIDAGGKQSHKRYYDNS